MTFKLGCVGYTTKALKNWSDFASPVSAPENYKDPSKISAYVKEATERQADKAGTEFLQCEFADFCVVDGINCKPRKVANGEEKLVILGCFTHIAVIGASLMRHLLMREKIAAKGSLDPEDAWLIMSLRNGHQYLAEKGSRPIVVFDPVHALACTSTLDEKLSLVAKAYGFNGEVTGAFGRASLAGHLSALLGCK